MARYSVAHSVMKNNNNNRPIKRSDRKQVYAIALQISIHSNVTVDKAVRHASSSSTRDALGITTVSVPVTIAEA